MPPLVNNGLDRSEVSIVRLATGANPNSVLDRAACHMVIPCSAVYNVNNSNNVEPLNGSSNEVFPRHVLL